MTETPGNIDALTANAVPQVPALIKGDLLDGMNQSDDWFKISVTGAGAANPKSIHVATGGDALADMHVQVLDTDGLTPLGSSEPDAAHKELLVTDITVDGAYYVRVFPGDQFDAAHSAYELIVGLE
jgi:hypothetical protein